MIIEKQKSVRTRQVAPSYQWQDDDYPFYLARPIKTEAGNDFSLLFCLSAESYIILLPKQKRYQIIKAMQQYLETADFPIFEIK
jgi:hypothetical protein